MLMVKGSSNPTALSTVDVSAGTKRQAGGVGGHFHLPLDLVDSSVCKTQHASASSANV